MTLPALRSLDVQPVSPFLQRGEIGPECDISAFQLQPGASGFHRTTFEQAPLLRPQAEHEAYTAMCVGRHARSYRVDQAVQPASGQAVEKGRFRSFQRGPAIQFARPAGHPGRRGSIPGTCAAVISLKQAPPSIDQQVHGFLPGTVDAFFVDLVDNLAKHVTRRAAEMP